MSSVSVKQNPLTRKVKKNKTEYYPPCSSTHDTTITKETNNVHIIRSSPTVTQNTTSLPSFSENLLNTYFKDQK